MLQALCDIFPDAPIYTLIYDEAATNGIFKDREIRTSFLQKMPFAKSHHYAFPLLMPLGIEQFNFDNFDLIISISASFAKGIITKPDTRHICYCLTPPRFLWDSSQKFIEEFGYPKPIRKLLPPFMSYLRVWDSAAAQRPDKYWAISNFVQSRIAKYYNLPAEVIYPPVDVSKFSPSNHVADYFLMVGRLVSYKKFDIAIEAFNKLGLPLKIAGIGPEMNKLKKTANANIVFLGMVSDDELARLYSQAQALVFPQEEDFGIVPLEAMASGRPVIAYRGGGATETILENKTGIFFDVQNSDSLIEAIEKFRNFKFNFEFCRAQAEKFDTEIFKKKILEKINDNRN
ncbi:MAG: Glycosyl transferase group 1 [Candidatus Yanofskybacteria bacterium GW2011_GWA1_44_21]|nr:MAG: Glycosyl transferase group 1 [Candidatus Yanofskybacteria bacterium GW2011_GWA2_44_10]KKT50889.1 MAG: Glycosyl transferase group 1 [Candidatus Yanofskybacteria bacterium GW2011_GWA1_44_21]KKT90461.1 MAG: Glycosyl transferase group 1 [Candidatus Yanofskybacteria bacterium GW2011_GWB1_45_11]